MRWLFHNTEKVLFSNHEKFYKLLKKHLYSFLNQSPVSREIKNVHGDILFNKYTQSDSSRSEIMNFRLIK